MRSSTAPRRCRRRTVRRAAATPLPPKNGVYTSPLPLPHNKRLRGPSLKVREQPFKFALRALEALATALRRRAARESVRPARSSSAPASVPTTLLQLLELEVQLRGRTGRDGDRLRLRLVASLARRARVVPRRDVRDGVRTVRRGGARSAGTTVDGRAPEAGPPTTSPCPRSCRVTSASSHRLVEVDPAKAELLVSAGSSEVVDRVVEDRPSRMVVRPELPLDESRDAHNMRTGHRGAAEERVGIPRR